MIIPAKRKTGNASEPFVTVSKPYKIQRRIGFNRGAMSHAPFGTTHVAIDHDEHAKTVRFLFCASRLYQGTNGWKLHAEKDATHPSRYLLVTPSRFAFLPARMYEPKVITADAASGRPPGLEISYS